MDVLSGNQPAPGEMENLPFPAQTRQAAGVIGGVQTDVMAVSFSDKILVTISQNGRLAHWLHVPLENTNPGTSGYHTIPDEGDDSLLPLAELTATTVLGGRSGELESIGHLYACQIANAIATKNPSEKRLLVVGLGLDKLDADRDIFFGIIDLVLRCI
ncbi:proteasome assembly chaperone 3 [Coccidioides immitis RS]|uniref:Proteasome assembly chaperone 3 n=6 Tax=Coccidioides TaxID=5500 RepID=A0A0E1RVM9_COCIM|nr:proteasome assembly chaperone 3 [Coccidioides immitis RS]XP_003072145.1 hypothetical protein CPC735_013180 [Coccidioides posadasii C735 delta SOWgp]KMM71447.1 hypothetical protein CPAG_07754 [Coccidioides posadasii RMSCC 3488]KMP09583.1 hypothetical protein CIRG_09753 [Coccidioides immitis RMSCC 2394]KMU76949.1 hypothetical protein CISG_05991 [Coccidioides immitis RMSCC 3703]KMU90900.1 hypothetical protein CIHG_08556 [Coccidioides immitis H538.4]QVM12656.1 hypothetical protein D8B26_007275|eukprot:XP_003072145.1 hypothetical protein CPC735_013180 [Coccidioides posadasii C735 delta SOWgp]